MNQLPIGFHTAPINLFFEKEPDYSILVPKFEMLDFIATMNNVSICVIDFYRHEYAYISKNHLFLCRYSEEEAEQFGEKLAAKIIYEEDKLNQSNMKDAAFLFINTLDNEKKKALCIYSTHRLKQKDGTVFLVSNHYKPLTFDDNGNMWLAVCITTFATKNHCIESYIQIPEFNEQYIFSENKNTFVKTNSTKLTPKEQKILELAAQGYTSKEIAEAEKISLGTVKFHKQNILTKFNVQNISEATLYAYLHCKFK